MKKIILMFIIFISSFIIYKNNVFAKQISTADFSVYGVAEGFNSNSIIYDFPDSFNNFDYGILLFNAYNYGMCADGLGCNSTGNIRTVRAIMGDGTAYSCDIGNGGAYTDNNNYTQMYTISCPVTMTGSYLDRLQFYTTQNGQYIGFSTSLTYVSSDFFVDSSVSDKLSALQTSSNTIINSLDTNTSVLRSIFNYEQDNNTYIRYIFNILNNNIKSSIDSVNQSVQETNDTIKSDNTSGAESSADALVNNSAFDDSTGLSAVIGLPLTFINNLSNTCHPITLTIPYMDYTFQLPCIQNIVNNFMPGLVVVIKVIVNGLIIYWILLDIFKIVKSAKNPEEDRIEVLDL